MTVSIPMPTPTLEPEFSTPLARAAYEHAARELADDRSGHDLHHVRRVVLLAQPIAAAEGADRETVEIIAALHDVADFKFTHDELSGSRAARTWLQAQGADQARADRIAADIAGLSFKGAHTPTKPLTLEGKCVWDADKLDAIGALGAARAIEYGASTDRPFHDPSVPITLHRTTEEYLNHRGTTTNHFHEKLLLLLNRLHTDTARELAQERHDFMLEFLRRVYAEWNGRS